MTVFSESKFFIYQLILFEISSIEKSETKKLLLSYPNFDMKFSDMLFIALSTFNPLNQNLFTFDFDLVCKIKYNFF